MSAHARVTAPIVLTTFTEAADLHGYPASTLTDNGMGLHRPTGRPRPPRRQELLRSRTQPPPHRAEELPAKPPDHLRQGRAVPTDDEEVATRPAHPAEHARRPPGAPRPVPRRVQPPTSAPLAPPPGHPGHRLQRPTQSRPWPRPDQSTPTTASATTRSARPAPSPCAWPAACATSASAEPTPGPTSSCSSRTSTSESSTPPPENSSASSPSTHAATTSPPADHPDPPERTSPDLRNVGPGHPDVLRHHTCSGGRI